MRKYTAVQKDMLRRRAWFRFFRAITILVLLVTAIGLGAIVGLFSAVAAMLPNGEALSNIRPASPSRVLACDGSLLAKIYEPDQNREIVPINKMGYMINATLAIEDIRFFTHPGIDMRGIGRALLKDITSHDTKEGASTITQQLARNLYLTRERKITRKLQEMLLALELERRYSKEEILETYLNQTYYGSNRYGLQSWGVEVASQNYFGKDVGQLTLAESAMLAGLPKNPRDYNPYRYPKQALARRHMVLDSMLQYHLINQQEYDAAIDEPLKLAPEKNLDEFADYHAPYFVSYILRNELKHIFGQDAPELTYHYGIDIYTSLDPRMQKTAEEVVVDKVTENKARNIDDGALISLDPQTGFIKAMVGGTDFRRDQFNVITQGHRQPGSSFKAFDYSTAFMHGYTPDTIIYDRPGHYPSGAGFWTPKNDDGRYMGPMPLKKALWLSRNAAAAGVAYDVGIKRIIDIAHRMGIIYPLEPVLPTALGASVVVPMEMCSAYSTLANHGVHNPPTGIVRITGSDGEVLYEYRSQPYRAIPSAVADSMKETMRGVIERGTGRSARCPFPASGKTGTTNSFRDAWFIGYTDDLTTAVWVGNRHNQPMNHTFGATVPAPIWHDYMLVAEPIMAAEHKETAAKLAIVNALPEPTDLDYSYSPKMAIAHGDEPQDDLNLPATKTADANTQNSAKAEQTYTVDICQDTGLRATPWCPNRVKVTYVKGHPPYPPTKICTQHTGPDSVPMADGQTPERDKNGHLKGVVISICAETGKIATDKCPTVLLRRFTHDPPTETCPLHGSQ